MITHTPLPLSARRATQWLYASALTLSTLSPCAVHAGSVTAQPVAQALRHPWSLAFLPDGQFLITERTGALRIITSDGQVQPPITGIPASVDAGQGGLLDVALDSDFTHNRQLYLCLAQAAPAGQEGTATALWRAQLSTDGQRLENSRQLFVQQPYKPGHLHYGCRITERRDGTLMLALGERSRFSQEAQDLRSHLGKVVRLHKDGSVPPDNPFVGRNDALPEIWSWGHRNPQGATLGPDDSYWLHEHGPQGGDEVNRPEAGKNYGWPVITYGVNYGGAPIGDGLQQHPGMEQPLHYWTPSIAPSGMSFVTSERYPGWEGSLLVGALKAQRLERLLVHNGQITGSEHVLPDLGQRVRDVRQGPDGWIYVLTDGARAQLLRLHVNP